jgi:hypothetical protein
LVMSSPNQSFDLECRSVPLVPEFTYNQRSNAPNKSANSHSSFITYLNFFEALIKLGSPLLVLSPIPQPAGAELFYGSDVIGTFRQNMRKSDRSGNLIVYHRSPLTLSNGERISTIIAPALISLFVVNQYGNDSNATRLLATELDTFW